MARFRLWVFAAALCLCTGSILVGCGGSEKAPAPAVKQVVKGKIPPTVKKVALAPVQTTAKPQPADLAAPVQATTKPKPEAAVEAATTDSASAPKPYAESEAVEPPAVMAPSTAPDQAKPKLPQEQLIAIAGLKKLLSLETEYSYIPEGKTDPFASVFDVGSSGETETKVKKREKREPISPIEKVDLKSLKLTAVILAPNGNLAMVVDASGKGYVIHPGDYIGNREGQVTEILADRLVVTEKVEDNLGRTINEKRELELPKPPGEM